MEKKYYIKINDMKVEVSEEIFTEYMRAQWREENQDRRSKKRNCSLEAMNEQGKEIASVSFTEDKINDIFLYKELQNALLQLNKREQTIIGYKFYANYTEREIATKLNISHQAVNKRLNTILKKLKVFLKNGLPKDL